MRLLYQAPMNGVHSTRWRLRESGAGLVSVTLAAGASPAGRTAVLLLGISRRLAVLAILLSLCTVTTELHTAPRFPFGVYLS